MKKLRDLIDYDLDLNITGITDDSRLVKDGFLFVATKGYNVDHFDYIDDAIKNGCSFIVCDREFNKNFPHIVVDNIFETYIELCKKYYEVDPKDFSLIGVTGTDGKTTTTTIIKELLEECAYIGTNGVWVNDIEESTSNTTPCISELYEDLKIIKDNNVNTVSMEVSSEALLHDRVHGFIFDVVCFTNITGDHLNVHKSFDDYIACKMKLLDHVKDDGYIVFNGDDNTLKIINKKNSISFGFNEDNDYVISDVKYLKRKTIITLRNNDLEWTINSPFIGEYNVYNVVMAFIVGHLFKVDDCLLLNKIEQLRPIKGRCEFLDYGQDFDIVLDYAHTINGINSILDTFSNYETIITVTGSAGGREVEKRSVIGKSVIEKSDFAIFTMDDPRFEDPDEIIDQMVGDNKDYYRIVDREDAIRFALSIAYPGSVVLILGKGRDNYMAIKDKKIHYNDFDVITNYFKKE
ncbi:MAG: UDP-N-acetylmuramoyl-L-alanyl-D-glutamate--2,6-diaminopimelate ligase [Bacilli bacterium]|nr:UDP-N-acetylmuramoyl-L-alanyl-D-glutamate--2,6-diaminopimelate ligase [Bacilli bacterium]